MMTAFQSTHPRGVRLQPSQQSRQRGAGFNPRTRVGCDLSDIKTYFGLRRVSIHAPAWGATEGLQEFLHVWSGFQSTHPRGVRRRRQRVPLVGKRTFQSTHPRGVRLMRGVESPAHACFNPRTRVGCDHETVLWYGRNHGFNPRTRVGCDVRLIRKNGKNVSVSIHAPAWGATALWQYSSCVEASFNPRTRVGCDCFHVLSSRFP